MSNLIRCQIRNSLAETTICYNLRVKVNNKLLKYSRTRLNVQYTLFNTYYN